MSKDLTFFKDFKSDVPSLFDFGNRDLFSGFSERFSQVMNGKCDFDESDDKYVVELEVPGVKKDEVEVNLKGDHLTIAWSVKKEKKAHGKSSRYERSEGSFSRSFYVEGADPDKIDANLKHGVLKIVLPKKSDYRPRLIEIK